jgi:biotin-(acetyl-CoA carboxylase) ligase
MHLPDPKFPPLFKGHPVKAPRKPFAEACRLAETHALGAADVVWSRSTARADLALVLEPDVTLERSLEMAPLMMVALGDCLGALAPPKLAVHYRWPTSILLNGAKAGEVRLACPRIALDRTPAWLVVGASLEIVGPDEREDWTCTSLTEEAGQRISRSEILQSLAAHFLAHLNAWHDDGFAPVHDQWLFRAEGREAPTTIEHAGERVEGQVLGLDQGVNLILKTAAGRTHRLAFVDCIEMIEQAGES